MTALENKKNKRYEPYYSEDDFIDFCNKMRNINFHERNDNYYITDETLEKLENILDIAKNPFKVISKSTRNVYSRTLSEKVLQTMKEMNGKSRRYINNLGYYWKINSLKKY